MVINYIYQKQVEEAGKTLEALVKLRKILNPDLNLHDNFPECKPTEGTKAEHPKKTGKADKSTDTYCINKICEGNDYQREYSGQLCHEC